MSRTCLTSLALAAAVVPAVACGEDITTGAADGGAGEVCQPRQRAGLDLADEPCSLLSSHAFFTDGPAQVPADGVVPYDINTPLFSDYAAKHRFLWLPDGQSMQYSDTGVFDLPVGAVLIKTFGYPDDMRDPSAGETLIETRLLIRDDDGWIGRVYVWKADQSDAVLSNAGARVDVSWIDAAGQSRELGYIVPNTNQCSQCHIRGDSVQPIGIQAKHLNRDFDYGDGTRNQLQELSARGMLSDVGAVDSAPRAPVFDDPDSGTLAERARAWLDINCAHCHNPDGPARTSGLDLRAEQDQPSAYGVCKTPVAAGAGSGDRDYSIVPGQPDQSILVFRIESVEPDVRMPELLRQMVHVEGVAVVRDWIAELDGSCGQ